MYSSLRYLLPAQASGAEWSSRFAKRETRGWFGVVDRVGSGWIGDGDGYKIGWRGILAKAGGSWSGIDGNEEGIVLCTIEQWLIS